MFTQLALARQLVALGRERLGQGEEQQAGRKVQRKEEEEICEAWVEPKEGREENFVKARQGDEMAGRSR